MQRVAEKFKLQVTILGTFVLLIWFLETVDVLLLRQSLNTFGIWPRQMAGLWGILFMPLLHGGMSHVAANTMPLLILGWLVMWRRISDFLVVTIISMLVSGLGLWFLGSSGAVYIGASGLIFGYLGFLLLRGYFERSAQSIFIALVVAFLYGGLLLGVLPRRPGISWEAHLFGFLGGVLAARFLSRPLVQVSPSPSYPVMEYEDNEVF